MSKLHRLKLNKNLILLILIWGIGFFLRCYRQTDLLGFYYDQGRDAQITRDIITGQNFPAIGPTTGIAGVYLGPFWFYLITPGYFLGGGNPAVAAAVISFFESLTVFLIYYLISHYFYNPRGAILGASIWSFSYYLIRSSRWFGNPTILPFFVLLILLCCLKIVVDRQPKYFPWLFFLIGLSLQLELASAVFFIPVIGLFFILNRPVFRQLKLRHRLWGIALFLILLLPQVAFDLKNHFFLTKNILAFASGKTFSPSLSDLNLTYTRFLAIRLSNYYQYFFNKLDTNLTAFSIPISLFFLFGIIVFTKRHAKSNPVSQLLLLWLLIPLFLLLFYTGNYARLYDYYITGLYPVFVILIALIFSSYWWLFLIFAVYFINGNFLPLKNYLSAGLDGPQNIVLGNEQAAVDYLCHHFSGQKYNLDIYVPPVIPYSYNYLLSWRHLRQNCQLPVSENTGKLVLIYEYDDIKPDHLHPWLSQYSQYRQRHLERYGGVTLEEITR